MTTHPGPSELRPDLLTRSELGALLEHLFYRLPAGQGLRKALATRMPDAYQRLTSAPAETMATLTIARPKGG